MRGSLGEKDVHIDLSPGRDHDDAHRARKTVVHQAARHVEAVLVAKAHIDKRDIRPQCLCLRKRLGTASCDSEDSQPLSLEQDARSGEKRWVVVDYQAAYWRELSIMARSLRGRIAASCKSQSTASRVRIFLLPAMRKGLRGGIVLGHVRHIADRRGGSTRLYWYHGAASG